jgi:hypothetical protein
LKWMAEAMGGSLKTEERRSHNAVSSFRPWVRRAEGYRGTGQLESCMQVPVKPRRPPSLPLICVLFPDHASFSVLREPPMAFFCDYFKKLNCYPAIFSRSRSCRDVVMALETEIRRDAFSALSSPEPLSSSVDRK